MKNCLRLLLLLSLLFFPNLSISAAPSLPPASTATMSLDPTTKAALADLNMGGHNVTNAVIASSLITTTSGGYLYSNFRQPNSFFDGTEYGSLAYSADGINYAEIYGLNTYVPPNDGVNARGVRDCSITKTGDTYFIIYSVSGGGGSGFGKSNVGVTSSPDLVHWTHVTDVIPSGSVGFAAPRWFIDPSTLKRWAIGQTGAGHLILIENTSTNGATWTNQTGNLTFSGGSSTLNGRDAYIIYKAGTYYLYWFDTDDGSNYHLATNTTLTAGGWVDQGAQSFSNTGEGVCVFLRPDGKYMGYISGGSVMKYFESTAVGSLTSWTALQNIAQPPFVGGVFGGGYDNGTVLVIPDAQTKQDALGALAQRVGALSPLIGNLAQITGAVCPYMLFGTADGNENALILNATSTAYPTHPIGISAGDGSGDLHAFTTTGGMTISNQSGQLAKIGSSTVRFNAYSTNGLVKFSSSNGTLALAASGTDYAPATSGSSVLKGNGSGGTATAVAGTDYVGLSSTNAITGANEFKRNNGDVVPSVKLTTTAATVGIPFVFGNINNFTNGHANCSYWGYNVDGASGDVYFHQMNDDGTTGAEMYRLQANFGGFYFWEFTVPVGFTNNDVSILTAGKGLVMKGGANARIQTTGAMTLGSVTVSNTSLAAGDMIIPSIHTPGGTVGSPFLFSRTDGTGFTIHSTSATDTSTIDYLLIKQN